MDDLIKPNKNEISKVKRLVEIQAILKELKPELDSLKAELLETMQSNDVEMLRTGQYTLYRSKRITPQVTDYNALKSDLLAKDIEVITEEKFAPQMTEVFKQAIEEGKKLKGLEALETEYVGVRIAK